MGFTVNTTYTVIDCPTCGMLFAITDEYRARREDDGKDFYCPNRHVMQYGDSTRKQLQRTKERLAAEKARHDQTRAELDQTERRRRATKGQLTKTRKRVANGVCPCCNRSFADLAAHMQTKHPDYAPAASEPVTAS